MTDTIILAAPGPARAKAHLAREERQLRLLGGRILTNLSHGTVATIARERIAELRSQGFHVAHYENTDRVEISGRSIDIDDPTKGLTKEERVPSRLAARWPLHVVQLLAPPFPEWREAVTEVGEIVGRAGTYGLYVRAYPEAVDRLSKLPFVSMVSPLQPAWKLDPRLVGANGVEGMIAVTVLSSDAAEKVQKRIADLGGKLIRSEEEGGTDRVRLVTEIDRGTALQLAALPETKSVSWLAPATVDGEREVQILAENLDDTPAPNTGPVTGYQGFLSGLNADGSGVTVAIADSGIDQGANNNTTGHLDLRGRQAAYIDYTGVGSDQSGHGTHVAGIAAGDASTGTTEGASPNNFLWGQGVAPGAQFVGQAMQSATDPTGSGLSVPAISTLCRDSVNNGATVQNDSWSTSPSPNTYTQWESDFDARVRDADSATTAMEALTVVFAARNDGGLAQTIGDPSSAKNVITVGNGLTRRAGVLFPDDDIRGVNGRSSRGPASGGRIKPDILAPGTDVSATMSAASNDTAIAGTATYTYKTGTSMAAPHVTGACAVLTEWWRNRTGGKTPSPAMLKALLINGAEDMAGGSNWRAMQLNLINPATNTYQVTGMGFVPTSVSVANVLLNQVGSTAAMPNQSWNFNAGTLTARIALVNQPFQVRFHCLDVPLTNLPNNDQGWGRVSLENIVYQTPQGQNEPQKSDRGPRLFLDQRHAFTANGQVHTWRIQPANLNEPMRATLVWTDAPGSANDNTPLVNNLDLELSQTNGASTTTWRGNPNNFSNGFSTPGGSAGTVDNVECVFLQSANGVYTLTVRATTLTADARSATATTPWQDYALVLENAIFATANPVSVSLTIDRSTSMVTSGYVATTQTASKQFIDSMKADDHVGVVSFGNDAKHEYAASNKVVKINGNTEKDAAKAAIDNIQFSGCTYMGQGLQFAESELAGAVGNRAVVLLSDGKDNKGCDSSNASKPWAVDVAAALSSSIEVYTCAMGPLSDQSTLENIADLTGGLYYYMPTIDDLTEIYNFIRGNVTSTGVIVNTTSTASSSRVAATVECGADQVMFACHWHNSNLRFVSREPRDDREIQVTLRTPTGKTVSTTSSWLSHQEGDGYVIFTIEEPAAGRWFVEVKTANDVHTRYTVGGWVRSDLDLVWDLPRVVRSSKLQARVGFGGDDDRLSVRYSASLTAPRTGIADLVGSLRDRLDLIQPDSNLLQNGIDPDLARLVAFDRDQTGAGKRSVFDPIKKRLQVRAIRGPQPASSTCSRDLSSVLAPPGFLPRDTPRIPSPLANRPPLPLGAPLTHKIEVPLRTPGSYTLRVTAEAIDLRTRCRYERVSARSFVVRNDR